jgi:hypothetical protein
VLLDLFGLDETSVTYDMTRAHSADILFLKARAFMWCITTGVACLLIGNICGVFGVNYFGMGWNWLTGLWH